MDCSFYVSPLWWSLINHSFFHKFTSASSHLSTTVRKCVVFSGRTQNEISEIFFNLSNEAWNWSWSVIISDLSFGCHAFCLFSQPYMYSLTQQLLHQCFPHHNYHYYPPHLLPDTSTHHKLATKVIRQSQHMVNIHHTSSSLTTVILIFATQQHIFTTHYRYFYTLPLPSFQQHISSCILTNQNFATLPPTAFNS